MNLFWLSPQIGRRERTLPHEQATPGDCTYRPCPLRTARTAARADRGSQRSPHDLGLNIRQHSRLLGVHATERARLVPTSRPTVQVLGFVQSTSPRSTSLEPHPPNSVLMPARRPGSAPVQSRPAPSGSREDGAGCVEHCPPSARALAVHDGIIAVAAYPTAAGPSDFEPSLTLECAVVPDKCWHSCRAWSDLREVDK